MRIHAVLDLDRAMRLVLAAISSFALAPSALTASAGVLRAPVHDAAAHQHSDAPRKKSAANAERPFGRAGDPRKVKRIVTIEMSDAMRFFPDQIRVKKGQTVRFVVRNGGELPHEMVLGTMDELKKHAAMMKQSAGMEHDDSNATHVEPGATGRIVWQFTRAGEFYYGCLVPGHFEAGMIGTVVVR